MHEINFSGDNLRQKTNIPSAEACQIQCEKDMECTHFTYDINTKKCYLKHGDGTLQKDKKQYISGPKQCKIDISTKHFNIQFD